MCADNALEALPESLGQCTNLVKLQASFNQLRSLPASVGGLSKLELLRVACNCLEEVPIPCHNLASDNACSTWLSVARFHTLLSAHARIRTP